jgi:hypothetical protein
MKKAVGAIVAVVIAVIALGALIHFALVWDGFAAHSKLGGFFSVARWNTLDLSHLDEWNQAAKDKYGPRSSTAIRGRTWEAYVEGQIVERKVLQSTVSSAYGVFMVPQKDSFPFEVSIDPKHILDPEFTTDNIKRKLVATIPAKALEFDAQDWRVAHCHSPEAPDFGFFKSVLRLGPTDVCLIRLKAEGTGTLVIGYAVVYGEPWTRPLSKRICRTLSASWVNSMMSRSDVKRPDFVGCLLANRSSEGPQDPAEVLSAHFFEVRDDRSLAVFD